MKVKEEFLSLEAYHTVEAAEEVVHEYERLQIFKKAIYLMASKRQETKDDYIRIAKQAIADYERDN